MAQENELITNKKLQSKLTIKPKKSKTHIHNLNYENHILSK